MECSKQVISGLIIFCCYGCAMPPSVAADSLLGKQGISTGTSPSEVAPPDHFEGQFIVLSRDFSEICLRSDTDPMKIAETAERLGWFRTNEWALEGTNKASWSSFPPEQVLEKGKLPFILELVDQRDEEAGSVQCSITMWGNGVEPAVGRNEMTLAREILSKEYLLGDIKEKLPDSTDATRPPFHRFSFNFSESDSDDRLLGYLWMGGTHWLIAARSNTAD